MTFNSLAFAAFLPAVLLVYWVLDRRRQNAWLLLASYVFYGWWDWRFLGLLALVTLINFTAAIRMAAEDDRAGRRRWLALCLVADLALLGFFKYFDFFLDSAAALLSAVGFHPSLPVLRVILPVGISFYTFQSMAYAIDVYRGHVRACSDLLTYSLFVSFFPQVVAGPIARASHLLPQFERGRRVTWLHLQEGTVLILVGLFKKVGVADAISPLVDVRFQAPHLASGSDLLLSAYLFAVQIYCDFSGYSDMARGVARLLGIDLMVNFRQPYFASSIAEFWQRWHMSLSTWLRDYLFLPLSMVFSRRLDGVTWMGVRDDVWIYSAAAMATMLPGGLWHGARWTFVAWGAFHGLCLCVQRYSEVRRRARHGRTRRAGSWRRIGGTILTFHVVVLAWVFFRSDSFQAAWAVLAGIASWQSATSISPIGWTSTRLLLLIGTLLAVDALAERTGAEHSCLRWHWAAQGLAYGGLAVLTIVLGNIRGDVPFVYFQF